MHGKHLILIYNFLTWLNQSKHKSDAWSRKLWFVLFIINFLALYFWVSRQPHAC